MASPTVWFGQEGDQFGTSIDKHKPLGTRLVLTDGREFRYCRNGSVTGVAANLYQAAVPEANHVGRTVQAVAAIGARDVAITLGATAAAENLYEDGFVTIHTVAGVGYTYKIKEHAAVLSSGIITLKLYTGLQVALTASSTASILANPYGSVVIAPATTRTAPAVGAMMKPLVAAYYGWLQTKGAGPGLTAGTVVVGDAVISPTGAEGAVGPRTMATVKETVVGHCLRVSADTVPGAVLWDIPG